MKKCIACAIVALFSIPFCASAQERFAQRPSTEATGSVSLDLSTVGAGLHYDYEHPIARRATVIGRVGAHAGVAWGTGFFGDWSYWMIAPSVDIEPRFYYNLDRRDLHGRSTDKNAGSFLALQIKNVMPFGYISDRDLELVGATAFIPTWGFRRVWSENWLFEFSAGAALVQGWTGGFECKPHVSVRFGYSF